MNGFAAEVLSLLGQTDWFDSIAQFELFIAIADLDERDIVDHRVGVVVLVHGHLLGRADLKNYFNYVIFQRKKQTICVASPPLTLCAPKVSTKFSGLSGFSAQ